MTPNLDFPFVSLQEIHILFYYAITLYLTFLTYSRGFQEQVLLKKIDLKTFTSFSDY